MLHHRLPQKYPCCCSNLFLYLSLLFLVATCASLYNAYHHPNDSSAKNLSLVLLSVSVLEIMAHVFLTAKEDNSPNNALPELIQQRV